MVDTNKIFQDGTFFKNQAYTVSGIEAKLFKDEYGYSDNGAPIQFEYNKLVDFGEPFFLKELWQARTFLSINDSGAVTQEIYADGSLADTYTVDKTDIPVTTGGI